MASETTFDHWKVVFSWGKMRKSRFSQKPLNARFWAFGFLIYTSSFANLKKIHRDTFSLSHCMFLPLVQSHHYNLQNHCLPSSFIVKGGKWWLSMSALWLLDKSGWGASCRASRQCGGLKLEMAAKRGHICPNEATCKSPMNDVCAIAGDQMTQMRIALNSGTSYPAFQLCGPRFVTNLECRLARNHRVNDNRVD